MVLPKRESVLGSLVRELRPGGFSFTRTDKPPMVLFVWGRKRVLPVNINSMTITETEFTPSLEPIRATVAVDLTVIEGPNPAHLYTKTLKEVSSGLHLANLRAVDVTDLIIPADSEAHVLSISRYEPLPDIVTTDARGRTLASRTLRPLPQDSGTLRHIVEDADRLDQLAYRYYREPRKWWRLLDANPEFLSPQALLGKDPSSPTGFP